MPRLQKPSGCVGCPLEHRGDGFAPAEGPLAAWLLLVGEALGTVEAMTGRPFMGDAGGMLQRLFNLLGWTRDAVRIHNVINCHPPNDWFDDRAPWYHGALNHCRYLDDSLNSGPSVVVPMGATAIKRVLGYTHHKGIRVQDFHGSVTRDPHDRFWIVPTFHPSHLQRGASNLIGPVLWDLLRAEQVQREGWHPGEASIVVDPPLDWFRAWVDTVVAARTQDPAAYPISSDIETPDKAGGRDEGEITSDDRSFQIIRQNVSCHPDEGVTVPFTGPYIDELRRLHQSPGPIWEWNRDYDFERQVAAGQLSEEADSPRVVDLMWLAHVLQTDVPRGLGFWAPFYSDYGAWKHLAKIDEGLYGGVDGLQTHRIGFGVTRDLIQQGQYPIAMRHTHELYWKALRPAHLVGVKIDRAALTVFTQDLIDKARRLLNELQTVVPEKIAPLTPKGGMKSPPAADVLHVKASAFTRKGAPRKGKQPAEVKQELYQRARVVERLVLQEILVCQTCGAREIQRRHACKVPKRPKRKKGDPPRPPVEKPVPQVTLEVASVTRWFWQEPFNPDSVPQVLAYIHHRKHKAGRAKKSASEESTNRETLERLARTTKDPFYGTLLDYRAVVKVKGTYAEGTERRLDANDRIHPKPTFKPSTLRLSYVDPNITNVVADKDEERNLAAGFRKCIVAEEGCRLLEVDYSGIEAVLTGYFAHDPTYIRLAKIGIHAGLCSYIDDNPFDPSWPDDRIAAHILPYKTHASYDPCKRFIHGRAYGLTRRGMMLQFPHLFPTEKVAAHYEAVYAQMAPKVAAWQEERQTKASKEHYLGGGGEHPFTYKHWFWSVFGYRRLTMTQYARLHAKCKSLGVSTPVIEMNGQHFKVVPGPDHKRTLSMYPQGTAAAILKEAMLLLYDPASVYDISTAYYGQTPLRAPVHDSLLNEIPLAVWDEVSTRIYMVMQRPIPELPLPADWGMGTHLSIGVAAKAGQNWGAMTKVTIPGYDPEWEPEPMEFEDEDDWADLKRVV